MKKTAMKNLATTTTPKPKKLLKKLPKPHLDITMHNLAFEADDLIRKLDELTDTTRYLYSKMNNHHCHTKDAETLCSQIKKASENADTLRNSLDEISSLLWQ